MTKASSTNAKLTALYEQALTGDCQARNDLIEGLYPLVDSGVGKYAARNYDRKYYHDDLRGDATVALVAAVDRWLNSRKQIDNIQALATVVVRNAITTSAAEAPLVGPAASTVRRDCIIGKRDDAPTIESHDNWQLDADIPTTDQTAAVDLLDEIMSCCVDDLERQVFRLAAEGATQRIIAGSLGISYEQVQEIALDVEGRLAFRRKLDRRKLATAQEPGKLSPLSTATRKLAQSATFEGACGNVLPLNREQAAGRAVRTSETALAS